MLYVVEVTETVTKTSTINIIADTESDAKKRAFDNYNQSLIVPVSSDPTPGVDYYEHNISISVVKPEK